MIANEWAICPVCGCQKVYAKLIDGKEVLGCAKRCEDA